MSIELEEDTIKAGWEGSGRGGLRNEGCIGRFCWVLAINIK